MPRLSFSMLRGAVVPVLLVVLWEVFFRAYDVQSDAFAAPSAILGRGVHVLLDGTLLQATVQTIGAALGGLAIGALCGVSSGIALGLCTPAYRLFNTSIELIRPIPSVALIPVAMLVFGFGYKMEMAVVAFSTVWPLLILTRSAIGSVEPRLLEVAHVVGLSPWARIRKIVLPAALPRIIVALRLAIGIALVVAVTVEIAANPLGLGYGMMVAQQSLDPGLMFALLVWIGMLGWALNILMVKAQHCLLRGPGDEVPT